eukprot:gene22337-biopygen8751
MPAPRPRQCPVTPGTPRSFQRRRDLQRSLGRFVSTICRTCPPPLSLQHPMHVLPCRGPGKPGFVLGREGFFKSVKKTMACSLAAARAKKMLACSLAVARTEKNLGLLPGRGSHARAKKILACLSCAAGLDQDDDSLMGWPAQKKKPGLLSGWVARKKILACWAHARRILPDFRMDLEPCCTVPGVVEMPAAAACADAGKSSTCRNFNYIAQSLPQWLHHNWLVGGRPHSVTHSVAFSGKDHEGLQWPVALGEGHVLGTTMAEWTLTGTGMQFFFVADATKGMHHTHWGQPTAQEKIHLRGENEEFAPHHSAPVDRLHGGRGYDVVRTLRPPTEG